MSNYSANKYTKDTQNDSWNKIFEFIEDESRVLDIGCSSGNLGATLIQEKKCEVVGLDLNEQDVKIAKKQLSEAYVMNAETDNLSRLGKFDAIVFADVIEHLVDPVTTLKKIKKSLNPGGAVIFSIPNMAHIGTRLMLLEGRFEYAETGLLDKTHLHYYDKQEVRRVFADAGFTISKFDWVERYVPERIIEKRLEGVGLKPTKKFYDRTKEIDAVAYQYVGKSLVTNPTAQPAKLPFVSPYVMFAEEQIDLIEQTYKDRLSEQKQSYEEQIDKLLDKETSIISSLSWRITLPLRLINGVFLKTRQRTRSFIYRARRNPRLNIIKYNELKHAQKVYRVCREELAAIQKNNDTTTGVILHLYYPESWSLIRKKLKIMKERKAFDLFVTLTEKEEQFKDQIMTDFPGAHILIVPNWGRDVLPFLQVCSRLEELGYLTVLKIHSKKSPHRKDGNEWFTGMLDSLIPVKENVQSQLDEELRNKRTGIIGPQGHYMSMRVNYESNSHFFIKALTKIYDKKQAMEINKKREEYGFFAGTMFWIRIDAISSVLHSDFQIIDFERENGRIDGTLAHALERVFCIVPEVSSKNVYEASKSGIRQIALKTNYIPEWSNVHPSKIKRHNTQDN